MEIRVEITKNDIKRWQKAYTGACNNPDKRSRPRLPERYWIQREILRELPSGATSQKGQWAVDATLEPFVERALCKVPRYRREVAKERREAEQRKAENIQRLADEKKRKEEQTVPLQEHLQTCPQCTLTIGYSYPPPGTPETIEYTDLKPSGQMCVAGRQLVEYLIDSNILRWRGP